jgi:hypothetical protein
MNFLGGYGINHNKFLLISEDYQKPTGNQKQYSYLL